VDPSPQDLTDQIDEATTLLLQTAAKLTDEQVRQPSLLKGWSRAHLLTHIARSGDVLRGHLDGVRTGVPATGYGSEGAREAGIEAGARRSAAELTADVRGSAEAFRAAAEAVPAGDWATVIQISGKQQSADQILVARLVEIELHHVDLDAGYRPSDWPTTFNELQLWDPQRQWRADRLV
jgi:maleylpyruvate isomerase